MLFLKTVKNKDTAWDFVKYCMEPENAKEFNLGQEQLRP